MTSSCPVRGSAGGVYGGGGLTASVRDGNGVIDGLRCCVDDELLWNR